MLLTAFYGIVAQVAQDTAQAAQNTVQAAQSTAQAAQSAAQPAQQGGSIWGSLLIMLPIFAIMYFLMIRPQQKKQKEHEEMLSRVKAGDKVMTQSGLFGTVVRIADNKVTLEIAERVHVDFAQGAIANIISPETAVEKKEEK